MADAKLTIRLEGDARRPPTGPPPVPPPPGPASGYTPSPGQAPTQAPAGMDVRAWEQMLIRAERRRLAQQKDVGRTLDAPGMLPDAPPPDIFLKRWERTLQLAESQAPPAGPAGQGPQTLDLSQGPAYVNAALVARQAGEDMLRPGPGTPDPNLLAEEHLQYVLDQIAFIDEAMEKIQESLDDRKITLQDAQAMNERLLIEREWQVGRLHEHQEAVEKQNMPRQVADFIRMAKQAGREYVPDNVTATGTFEPVEEVDSPWVRSIESVIGRVTGGLAELPQDLADGLRPRLESLQDALAALGNTIEDTDLNRDAIEKMAERMAGHYTYARTQAVGRAEDELSGPAEVTLPWLDRLEGIVQKSAEGLKELPQDMAEGLGKKLEELRQAMADLGGTIEDTDVNRMAIDRKMDEFLGHYGDAKNKAVDQAKGDIFGGGGAGGGFWRQLLGGLVPRGGLMGQVGGLINLGPTGPNAAAGGAGPGLMVGGPVGVALAVVQAAGKALEVAAKEAVKFANAAVRMDADGFIQGIADMAGTLVRNVPLVGGALGTLVESFGGLLQGADSLAARLSQFNPQMAQAEAMIEVRRLQRDMERAQRLGSSLVDYMIQRDDTRAQLEEIMVELTEVLVPILRDILKFIQDLARMAQFLSRGSREQQNTAQQMTNSIQSINDNLLGFFAPGMATFRNILTRVMNATEQTAENTADPQAFTGDLFTQMFGAGAGPEQLPQQPAQGGAPNFPAAQGVP